MLWPAAFALMGDAVEDGERQQAMSLLNMCYMLGLALAMPIGGIVEDLSSRALATTTGSFSGGLFLSAVLFLGVSLTVLRLPTTETRTDHSQDGEGFNWREFLKTAKQIPAYLILAAITFCGIGFPMANVKLFALEEFRLSSTQFGGLVFPAAISMAALSVPMAKLGERIGRSALGSCRLGSLCWRTRFHLPRCVLCAI